MLKDNVLVGAISVFRQEVCEFEEKQIELLENFAKQAVIAIENARLLNELRQRTDDLSQRTTDLTEVLEQQTATSEVLQVISSSPGDLQSVFNAMLQNAVRICDATFGNIYRWEDDALHLVAAHNTPPAASVGAVELGGIRTALAVPMLKENELIGSFTVYRREVRPFTDKQIALIENFASQAIIAIENARLLNDA
jgi:GAF domain-containing protein